jgi:hypothetical protein
MVNDRDLCNSCGNQFPDGQVCNACMPSLGISFVFGFAVAIMLVAVISVIIITFH